MNVVWIPLRCDECENEWEGTPDSIPAPRSKFECPYCGVKGPVADFVRSQEGMELLETHYD